VLSATDYYAFGMSMKGRSWQSEKYRYGFNGKENDEDGGFQDYGMRVNKEKIGRFMSVDPITAQYPELTPYQFASNTPIMAIDLDGLEALARVRSEQQTAALKVAFAGANPNYDEARRILHYGQGNVFVDDNEKPSTFVKRTLPNAGVLNDNLPITLSYDKSINGIQVWGFEMVTDKGLPIKSGRFNLIGTIPPAPKDCIVCIQIIVVAPWGTGGDGDKELDKDKKIVVLKLDEDEGISGLGRDEWLNIDKWGDYIEKVRDWLGVGSGASAEQKKYNQFLKEQAEKGNRVPLYDTRNKLGDSMKVFNGTNPVMVPTPNK
jgi:RHS repeat-associated protein